MIGGGVFNKQVSGCRISVEFRLKKKMFQNLQDILFCCWSVILQQF